MSKQSEAKEKQGYTRDLKKCENCKHFKLDKVFHSTWMGTDYYREKNLRCGLGEFKVHKTATCNDHEATP